MAAYKQSLSNRSLHIVNRFTWGYNISLRNAIVKAKGIDTWFEKQLNPTSLTSARIDAMFPRLTKDDPYTAQQVAKAGTHYSWEYGNDLVQWTLARRIASANQVHEVMVDFWENMLHIPAGEDYSWPWRFDYDKTIRTYALTSFSKLLQATITHPAMTGYMTNFRNKKRAINENLGRELLELYSVGVDAGYTEDDVKASARLLTGYTLDTGDSWDFGYDVARHSVGAETVMGQRFENADEDGRDTVAQYLDFLALHPATADRIARRLVQRFVHDAPPDNIVAAVKRAYLLSNSDIKSCLRAIVSHPDFLRYANAKTRNPVEDMVATMRALRVGVTGTGGLGTVSWCAESSGLKPFAWPRPDGYPEVSATYASPARMLRSWGFHVWMADPSKPWDGMTLPPMASVKPLTSSVTVTDLVHHQSVQLTGRLAPAKTIAAAATLLNKSATTTVKTSSIDAWQLVLVRTAVLNSSGAMRR